MEVTEEAKEEVLAPAAAMALLVAWELASEAVLVAATAVANNNSNNSLLPGKLRAEYRTEREACGVR